MFSLSREKEEEEEEERERERNVVCYTSDTRRTLLQTGPWVAQLQPLLVDATAILDPGRGSSCQSNWF